MEIDVKVDIKEVTRELNRLQRSVIPAATKAALNKTASQVSTVAKRDIAKTVGLPQKTIAPSFKVFKSSIQSLRATVEASGKALNLIRFKAKQTRRGVTAKAWGKRKLYPGTFIANQGRTVFKRSSVGGHRVKRLPIEPVHGPSVPREFIRARVQRAMQQVVSTKFPKIFRDQIKYKLSKLR